MQNPIPSAWKITLLLCDSAQAVNGKLYILGGGWSLIGPAPTPMAIAVKVDVPWDETNHPHTLHLLLVDEDSQPVQLPTPTDGDQPVRIDARFEAGRPPGVRPGSPLEVPLAIQLGPLPLQPNRRFEWRCWVDEDDRTMVTAPFATRPPGDPRKG